uniref:Apple domain-containing protein n=2 Tax=Macrostomum lignano TaxID=282301 RepID=A0A1I8GPM6_9PLAT
MYCQTAAHFLALLLLLTASSPAASDFTFEIVSSVSSSMPVSMKSVTGSSTVDCSVKCAQTAGCIGFSWLQSLCQLFDLSAFSGTWLSSPPCEVFKKMEEPTAATSSPPTNITKLNISSCQHSNTYLSYYCTISMDGNRDQTVYSATVQGIGEWWEARLAAPAFVAYLTIYNRLSSASWLKKFNLLVDGVECNRVDLTESFSIANFTCNAFGSAVRVVNQLSEHLVICEVEIYGY